MKLKSKVKDVRIDKYLREETSFSRELLTKMINNGYVTVFDHVIKPSYKVKIGDEINIDESYVGDTSVVATKMDLNIVYEDNDVMVINKPSGLVVHPGNGNYDNTLVNGLLYYTDNLSDVADATRPGIVHRLDKDTTGLMLVAKSNKAHEILADDFKNKRVHREYVSLLEGVLPVTGALIDAPIGRDKQNFQKMAVCKDGKKAITHLTVIKKYKDYTLVRLVLETGRTHQIRVHAAYIGHPVYNDPVYSKRPATDFGQFLHSEYLKFTHPITQEVLEFHASLPEYFQDFIDKLD